MNSKTDIEKVLCKYLFPGHKIKKSVIVQMNDSLILEIKQHSKIRIMIEKCEECINKPDFKEIRLIGEGKSVNKALSISQLLQKKYPQLQETTNLALSETMKNEPKLTLILTKIEK